LTLIPGSTLGGLSTPAPDLPVWSLFGAMTSGGGFTGAAGGVGWDVDCAFVTPARVKPAKHTDATKYARINPPSRLALVEGRETAQALDGATGIPNVRGGQRFLPLPSRVINFPMIGECGELPRTRTPA
jgi:hypothetical protein